jgi:hypothetical protein
MFGLSTEHNGVSGPVPILVPRRLTLNNDGSIAGAVPDNTTAPSLIRRLATSLRMARMAFLLALRRFLSRVAPKLVFVLVVRKPRRGLHKGRRAEARARSETALLFILDANAVHRSERFLEKLRDLDISFVSVPSGMTATLQGGPPRGS